MGVQAVAARCEQLQHLELGYCSNITDASIQAVAEGCHQLQHLNLCGCSCITDAGVQVVAERCQQLQHLNLAGIRNISGADVLAEARQHPAHGQATGEQDQVAEQMLAAQVDTASMLSESLLRLV